MFDVDIAFAATAADDDIDDITDDRSSCISGISTTGGTTVLAFLWKGDSGHRGTP